MYNHLYSSSEYLKLFFLFCVGCDRLLAFSLCFRLLIFHIYLLIRSVCCQIRFWPMFPLRLNVLLPNLIVETAQVFNLKLPF